MSGFYIEVNKKDLKYIQKKFDGAQKNVTRVLRNAINQTATESLKKIKAGRSGGYTVKARAFNKEIQIQRANAGHLDATIKSKGRPRTLQQFKISKPKSGIKADVTRSGLKQLVNSAGAKAFMIPGGEGGLVAQRETRHRLPIKILHSNSVPMMVKKIYEGERGGQGDMQPFVQKTLHEKIMQQVEKLI